MKAVAAFLLVLIYLSISHGWTCKEGPQLSSATQIDAGQGKVVLRDRYSRTYFLSGSSWYRLGTVSLKHVSVGPAGIWGVDSSNRVYKYVAGNFIRSNGLYLQQVDAGGLGQVVGVTTSSSIHCLKSSIASTYKQLGTLTWNTLAGGLKYISCGPLNGCWGVNSEDKIFFTKISPTTCGISNWIHVPGGLKMIEVGTNGAVLGVNSDGHVFQRAGISSKVPQGKSWLHIPMCLSVTHVSYDLGRLWVVSKTGVILQCVH